jgi:hypothetical protein
MTEVAHDEPSEGAGLGTEISRLFFGIGLGSDIPELRGWEVTPVDFSSDAITEL